MDFCIPKFVKLLIKSSQIVLGAFVANGRYGSAPLILSDREYTSNYVLQGLAVFLYDNP